MIHLHKWIVYYDLKYTELDYHINRTYRYCKICHKWQREHSSWYETSWEDSYIPEGVEDLIIEEKAKTIIKDINMKKNAQR